MATYTGQLPGATQFGMYQAQANEAYSQALANIQNRRSDLLRQAGLEGVYDANGNLTDTRVAAGPGAEFGAYQQMMHGLAGQGEQVDAARAGLGFGGGLSQQLADQGQRDASQQSQAWGDSVLQGIKGLGQEQLDARQQYNDGLFQQMLGNVRGGIDAGQFNPADFSGLMDNYGPYGGNNPDPGPFGNKNNLNPSGTKFRPPKPRRRRR